MKLSIAIWLVYVASAYLAAGVLFAVPFAGRLVERIDRDAGGGSWGFRLIILPGVIALWPFMLKRFLAGRSEPVVEKSPHIPVNP